uniref:Uncharacterized protein n=1 Tax=Timema bartmani TaxID=61472 RepID=A0A7R9FB41_9NEOP|nr:unnamed protein product [Timema bartmani]
MRAAGRGFLQVYTSLYKFKPPSDWDPPPLPSKHPLEQFITYLLSNIAEIVEDRGHAGLSIPTDPIDLSYWVAQNLPLSDEQRLTVLKLDSAIQRLRWELNALQKIRVGRGRKKVGESVPATLVVVERERELDNISLSNRWHTWVE